MKSGIYRIKNIITSECYVGSSVTIERRFKQHQSALRKNKHPNPKLQASYNKYGADAFVYNVLDYCQNILEREQMFLDSGAFKFNILKVAGNNGGHRHSAETKAKISAAKKGKSTGRLGEKQTEETKAKISAANKNRKLSAETLLQRTVARIARANLKNNK